ncbi:MAG: HK97 gp10 family phage protein [Selenomonadaceae bacterium]|nr:HK97 gp10 family phage protein [Selenomonadaceae bacterium]
MARSSYRATGFCRGNIRGASSTLKELRAIGEHVAEAAKAALKQGVDTVVADAKNRCPVRTGKLRDSIKAEPYSDGASYGITANANNKGFYYGLLVEFSPMEGYRPFLYPALDAHSQEVYDNVKNAVTNAIRGGG